MNLASTIALRWMVSTRTRGEVQIASVSAPALELVLLGIPSSFTVAEAEGWMRDLAGVAGETSREDNSTRAIPTLLHHALTGLLFSQAELWSQPGSRGPCSVAFVDTAKGPAFGWVGEARVQVVVDGSPTEPQWVLVRDQDGREARAALLPRDRSTTLGIEFWPNGEDGSEAPVAIEAEWLAAGAERVTAIPAAAETPTPIAHVEPPAESRAAVPVTPAPAHVSENAALASLPLQQPGFAPPPHEQHADDVAGSLAPGAPVQVETQMPQGQAGGAGEEVLGPHVTAVLAALESGTMLLDETGTGHSEVNPPPQAQHPVGRWLGRLLGFARRTPREPERETATAEAPVSEYDSLLSESVPPTVPEAAEQTTLELPSVAPPMLVEPDAPDFAVSELAADLAASDKAFDAPVHRPTALPTFAPETLIEQAAADFARAEHGIAPVPLAASGSLGEVVRAMHDVDAARLPVLPSPRGQHGQAQEQPLLIDREPVGADAVFAIPRLPVRPVAPAAPPLGYIPVLPLAQEPPAASAALPVPEAPAVTAAPPVAAALPVTETPAVSPPEPVAPWLEPIAPQASRVYVRGGVPVAPPVLRVGAPAQSAESSPLLTPPVAPAVPEVSATVTGGSSAPAPAAVELPETVAAASDVLATDLDVSERSSPSGQPTIARRAWPALEPRSSRRPPKHLWVWVGVVAAVFTAGWLVGVVTNPAEKGAPGPFARLMRAVGLGAPHFVASINSSPTGAWIAVDGRDVARRTPASVELSPGTHTLKLSLPELGSTEVQVHGVRDEKVASTTSLNGGLEVYSSDANVPILVSLDGREVGYAPVRLESVVPGLHELQFTGPGMPAWAQTVQVGVRRSAQVVAHPMSAPANGVVQVQATINDERGASPLSGAQIWVDGQLRGVTPASFELPRGPHSLKLTWREETAPVQVIELPGGNQRFASFNFGLDNPSPQLTLLGGVHPASADEQVMVSATLTTLQVGDVREAWLHVTTPDGLWRRYPMTAMAGARGPVLVAMFPPASLEGGSARWYVSASTQQGDEYFSEMQVASAGGVGAAKPRRRAAGAPTP